MGVHCPATTTTKKQKPPAAGHAKRASRRTRAEMQAINRHLKQCRDEARALNAAIDAARKAREESRAALKHSAAQRSALMAEVHALLGTVDATLCKVETAASDSTPSDSPPSDAAWCARLDRVLENVHDADVESLLPVGELDDMDTDAGSPFLAAPACRVTALEAEVAATYIVEDAARPATPAESAEVPVIDLICRERLRKRDMARLEARHSLHKTHRYTAVIING